HQAAVYRAALAALGSPADAEDAAQDAFVTAFRRLDGFRGDASFKTWLLTIAWHQAINRRRSLSRWLRQFGPSDAFEPCDSPDGLSGGGTPEELAMGAELRRDIARGIRALPPKLRDALLLAQAGEYSYGDIGSMLRAPVGTIKWRVSEARRRVKQSLIERGYEDGAAGR